MSYFCCLNYIVIIWYIDIAGGDNHRRSFNEVEFLTIPRMWTDDALIETFWRQSWNVVHQVWCASMETSLLLLPSCQTARFLVEMYNVVTDVAFL